MTYIGSLLRGEGLDIPFAAGRFKMPSFETLSRARQLQLERDRIRRKAITLYINDRREEILKVLEALPDKPAEFNPVIRRQLLLREGRIRFKKEEESVACQYIRWAKKSERLKAERRVPEFKDSSTRQPRPARQPSTPTTSAKRSRRTSKPSAPSAATPSAAEGSGVQVSGSGLQLQLRLWRKQLAASAAAAGAAAPDASAGAAAEQRAPKQFALQEVEDRGVVRGGRRPRDHCMASPLRFLEQIEDMSFKCSDCMVVTAVAGIAAKLTQHDDLQVKRTSTKPEYSHALELWARLVGPALEQDMRLLEKHLFVQLARVNLVLDID